MASNGTERRLAEACWGGRGQQLGRVAGISLLCAAIVLMLAAASATAFQFHTKTPTESFGTTGGCEATGTGTLTSGSAIVTEVKTSCGTFAVGQEVVGNKAAVIRSGSIITAVGVETLTLSKTAESSASGVAISSVTSPFGSLPTSGILAFQQQSNRAYVLDGVAELPSSAARLYGFNALTNTPAGGCLPLNLPAPRGSEPDIAVDNSGTTSQGNVYYISAGSGGSQEVFGYSASCTLLPGFPFKGPEHTEGASKFKAELHGIAVDPSGDVWLSNNLWLERYTPTGAKVDERKVNLGAPRSIAFDAAGNLLAVIQPTGRTWEFSAPNYENPSTLIFEEGAAIAVDHTTGDVYEIAHDGKSILRFPASGGKETQETFGQRTREIYSGLAIDEDTGKIYAGDLGSNLVDVFGTIEVPLPTTGSVTNPASTEATLNGTVRPDGVPLTGCRFEWVTETTFRATGFESLASGGEAPCNPAFGTIPPDSEKHPVSATATGLVEGTAYRFRLTAKNANGENLGAAAPFTLGPPEVETVGSPIRSATTASFDGRLNAHGLASSFRFEYGTQGPCDANPCVSTPLSAGPVGNTVELVAAQVGGLQPSTTYHYRVLAENGGPGGIVAGADQTLMTRASDAALSHGHFPGPPASDRAWEQVSAPDTGGNPIGAALALSNDGERVIYEVLGGLPGSPNGTLFDDVYAQRTATGWLSGGVYPPRSQAPFDAWLAPNASDDLGSLLTLNIEGGTSGQAGTVWRLSPSGGAAKLYEMPEHQYGSGDGTNGLYLFSDNSSRALLLLTGSLDPAHPAPAKSVQLYDVSSGTPKMAGLLPGNTVPNCGVKPAVSTFQYPQGQVHRTSHWVAADGSRAFFPSAGNSSGCGTFHLYMRDFAAETTTRIDGPPVSGPDCSGAFIRSTVSSVYMWTQSRLVGEDTEVGSCGEAAGGDIYRYDIAANNFECLTCGSWGSANVPLGEQRPADAQIAISPDGSHVYFKTARHLLAGANEEGEFGLYRLKTANKSLAYVGPIGGGSVGDFGKEGEGITADGTWLAFSSNDLDLNNLTGSANGGSTQYYLYNDRDRSLVCASCKADGQPPRASVPSFSLPELAEGVGPNQNILAEDGTLAFATPTALVSADQNTAAQGQNPVIGTDVYEWRDGRQLLVSDGLTSWPKEAAGSPQVATIDPSGQDIFFFEAAQLTGNALDAYRRLYDARIGGGFEEPTPSAPCALEDCQGTPKGTPEESPPGSASFQGAGNISPKPTPCAKGKVRRNGHCVSKHKKQNHKKQKSKKQKHKNGHKKNRPVHRQERSGR